MAQLDRFFVGGIHIPELSRPTGPLRTLGFLKSGGRLHVPGHNASKAVPNWSTVRPILRVWSESQAPVLQRCSCVSGAHLTSGVFKLFLLCPGLPLRSAGPWSIGSSGAHGASCAFQAENSV